MNKLKDINILKTLYSLKSFGYDYSDTFDMNYANTNNINLPDDMGKLKDIVEHCNLCSFSKSRNNILSEIKEIHKKHGTTVILISHNMEKIAEMASRLLVMHKGKIILDDSPRNIFEKKSKQLIEVGLGLPQVTECMHQLKLKGMNVFTGVLTVQDARNEILKNLQSSAKQ